uniref:Uncharacterized protein n=1 Tax=Timema tahoe TaxID=61484 RepID=A0A7R9IMD9_9NEOP|nr:unnamed protein product [Timema tahoe]
MNRGATTLLPKGEDSSDFNLVTFNKPPEFIEFHVLFLCTDVFGVDCRRFANWLSFNLGPTITGPRLVPILIISIKSDSCRSHDFMYEYTKVDRVAFMRLRYTSYRNTTVALFIVSFCFIAPCLTVQFMGICTSYVSELGMRKVEFRGNVSVLAWRESGHPFRNSDLPIFVSLVYCENSVLDHVATNAAHPLI